MTEISTRERAGEYDALETAKPDEPIFVLQGGDPFAPATIRFWAGLQRDAAMRTPSRDERMAMAAKATNAEVVSWDMEDYQRGELTTAAPKPKGYGGVEPDAARAGIARLSMLADRVYNAIAELSEVGDALAAMGGHAAAELKLRDAAIAAGDGVKLIEPRRHLPRAEAAALPELERVPDPEPDIVESGKDRRGRLNHAVPHFQTRKAAVREAMELANAEGARFVQIAGISFTADEVGAMFERMSKGPRD